MPLNPIAHGAVPSPAQLEWHRREVYGFIHFTVNTFTDREWGYGDENESVFAPEALDCRQWVAAAKAGGLTALILTAKHHDGFCLWPSATTTHTVAKSPFRGGNGDVVRELSDACREAGLGFGLYCSPWDRNNSSYGQQDYTDIFHAQWRELLTAYGPLCELWFDGANGGDGFYGGAREKRSIDRRTYYKFEELWAMCRRLQPGAVIFSDAGPDVRWCGNEAGFANTTHWAKVRPEGFFPGDVDDQRRLIEGDPDGSVWRPAEVDVSIRPGWFWHAHERAHSAETLFSMWFASIGRGAGMLLNLTPDRRGLIPDSDVVELRRFRGLIESFTAVDLARGRGSGPYAPLTDDNPSTWWIADTQTSEVVIELGQDALIGGIRIEEMIALGQRVESFAIDIRAWGGWFEFTRGTTIGSQRIFKLDPARGDAVRIRILASQAPAILTAIKVYCGH
ncbi:MAG: alpha-L-fucosidase [Planctomycetes bacterium]|nr:alpha-L-fucosidase [Planctomycetota bacterium]